MGGRNPVVKLVVTGRRRLHFIEREEAVYGRPLPITVSGSREFDQRLWAADVVVVLVEQSLETDRQIALSCRQGVRSARACVGDAGDAIHNLSTEERIRFCDDRANAC